MRTSGWLLPALLAIAGGCSSHGPAPRATASTPPEATVSRTTAPTGLQTTVTVVTTGVATTVPTTVVVSTTTATTSTETTRTTAAAAVSPEEAIGAFLNRGIRFVGDCTTADPNPTGDVDPALVGAYCSSVWQDRGDTRIYAIGPIRSEFDSFLLLERQSGGWVAVAGAPFNESGPPW